MNKTILFAFLLTAFGLQAQNDTVTFKVDMNQYSGSYTDVHVNGTFNNWCGACNPMSDPDNDGIYEVALPLPANDSIEYKFTVDGWTDQENFAGGEPCTKTSNGFTNRFLSYSGNTTLSVVCWNYCVDCASVPAAPGLPIDFESTTVNYATLAFGELSDTIVTDPTDPNNTVWQHDKPANAQTWAGALVGLGGIASPVPFTATETVMTMRVWSPDAGAEIRMKLEVAGNTSVSVETVDSTTVTGGWEMLTFDFSNEVANTPALDTAADYNQIVVFPNFGVDGATAGAKTYYIDDIEFVENVGLGENALEAFDIVPNPNAGVFRLQGSILDGNSAVKVVDMNGRLMFQSRVNANDSELDLRHLDNGVYLILIEADQKVYRQKMVLNR